MDPEAQRILDKLAWYQEHAERLGLPHAFKAAMFSVVENDGELEVRADPDGVVAMSSAAMPREWSVGHEVSIPATRWEPPDSDFVAFCPLCPGYEVGREIVKMYLLLCFESAEQAIADDETVAQMAESDRLAEEWQRERGR